MGKDDMGYKDPESNGPNSPLGSSGRCFCFPCFGSRRSPSFRIAWWQPIQPNTTPSTPAGNDQKWWAGGVTALKKIREWSELVAGPKWKTFIRRFNRNRNSRHGKFQYDSLSYALNFDEGPGQNCQFDDDDDYGGLRDFSSRYASLSAAEKVDTGKGKEVAAFG